MFVVVNQIRYGIVRTFKLRNISNFSVRFHVFESDRPHQMNFLISRVLWNRGEGTWKFESHIGRIAFSGICLIRRREIK